MHNSKEVWLPLPSNTSYDVSNFGRARSYAGNGRGRLTKPKMLKGQITKLGYYSYQLRFNKKRKNKFAHHLVLETFISDKPNGLQCAHLDGNPLNNKLSNLKWCSQSENQKHRVLHKTDMRGEKHIKSKLTKKDVFAIRRDHKRYVVTYRMLAKKYGVSKSLIDKVICKTNWSWL